MEDRDNEILLTEEANGETVSESEKAIEPEVIDRKDEAAEDAGRSDEAAGTGSDETADAETDEGDVPAVTDLEGAIEAVLFAAGNSVSIDRLAELLAVSKDEVEGAVLNLEEAYGQTGRGIELIRLEDSIQLGTKRDFYPQLMKMARHPKPLTLSDTVLETLSIIAYKQPVTRGQIEQIRGVSCDHAVNKLLEVDLIEEVGRLDAPGRPLLFGTTEQFLRCFGVSSIGDLPTVSPEIVEDFKIQAEMEASESLKVEV